MQNFTQDFYKKSFFTKSIFAFIVLTTTYIIPEAPRAMPSVADVFGGLSEQEIAEQVQMGQQFLEDLQKNGSPEEIAEFQRLLEDTLNSMSEDDFKDIQAIAQMVEPHIATAQEEPKPATEPAVTTKDTTVPSSDLEEFKKLIGTITQRIDDMLQKINSSKECAELIDAKWKNKSTFGSMKRQIHQLKTDRLAQKLCKKDIADDDKKLVDTLKSYLKDLTAHNDAFVVEDDFGLPASYAQEKKHVKQTQAFIDSCDEYIDKLMPLLEKFLQKWDPEALKIAKEMEATTKKATKEAIEAGARRPSATAPSKSAGTGGGYSPASQAPGYSDYGGYYPESYEGYPGGSASPEAESKVEGAPKAKSEISATAPAAKEKPKDKNNQYGYALNELEGHLNDDYSTLHENKFVDFIQKEIVGNYPDYTKVVKGFVLPANAANPSSQDSQTSGTTASQEDAWIDSKYGFPTVLSTGDLATGFSYYTTDMKTKFAKEFHPEFAPLHVIFDDLKNNISNMKEDDLKKLSTAKELSNVENRLKRYQKTFEDALPELKKRYDKNSLPATGQGPIGLLDTNELNKYKLAHDSFVNDLKNDIGSEVDTLLNKISSIKRSSKRIATKKQSQAKAPKPS